MASHSPDVARVIAIAAVLLPLGGCCIQAHGTSRRPHARETTTQAPAHPAAPKLSKRHAEPRLGFEIGVPEGWGVGTGWVPVMHYLDMRLWLDSRGTVDESLPTHLWSGFAESAEEVARSREQLPAGSAFVLVGQWGGPPGVEHLQLGTPEFEGTTLPPRDGSWRRSEGEFLTEYWLDFRKWGESWTAIVVFRKPAPDGVRRAAWAAVRRIRLFPPVGNPVWAANLAWRKLPQEARQLGDWLPTDGALAGNRRTQYERTANGFRVTFSVLDETGETTGRSWSFHVGDDGSVTAAP